MAKKPRAPREATLPEGAVGPRQPCPCGSGKRYKACHGAAGSEAPFVVRSFEGLPGECDWIALREFVQSGTAPLRLKPDAFGGAAKDATVLVTTLLPGIAPAMKRDNGDVWLATQVAHQSGDPSTDLACALGKALEAAAGESVVMPARVGIGERLQDVVDPDSTFEVTVHEGFDFWFEGVDDSEGTVAATLERINETVEPAARLSSVDAAYWASKGNKEHLRWVQPYEEEALLTALARLHESGGDVLLEGSRLVGSFRAHGLLVPVWDVPVGTGAEALEEPAAAFLQRLKEILGDDRPLTDAERAARNGLANRQITIR